MTRNKEELKDGAIGSELFDPAVSWFESMGWSPFPFQLEAWNAYSEGYSGVVNAPTGTGKTYSLFIPLVLNSYLKDQENNNEIRGLRAIWLTPIRALAKEILGSCQRACIGLNIPWKIAVRSGDTSTSERASQKKEPPQMLITTPESLHLLLASKGYPELFKNLEAVIVDEWHELIGSKRGVQVELALSRLKGMNSKLKIWGISATIGNMEESFAVLLGKGKENRKGRLIRSGIKKKIEVECIFPDEIETLPWAGHLGIKLLLKILPIIESSSSTLIFTNTRSQCEIWYQKILEAAPEMAGWMAMHHGSISRELRDWVENALHEGKLKAVVCTSSLDLGVDFRPVETIIQIGSPKGVARFMQRAGRSGHQPGATSKIWFLPTHSLELVEASALRFGVENGLIESRIPYIRSFDVLIQYLVTLAVSEGFNEKIIYGEIKETFCFESLTREEWEWCLNFIRSGGPTLVAYNEYRKVEGGKGFYKVKSRSIAMRHRLSIGTIVGDSMMLIKYVSGRNIGHVEEWFIAQLKPGDVFWFAGRSLELVRIYEMTVQVRKSNRKTGKVPSWLGGRIPLSSELSATLRMKICDAADNASRDPELTRLFPLMKLQQERSHIPREDELLVEYFMSQEGFHLLLYPFEGRAVHEGLGALLAYRISRLHEISFTIAMNDYGLELLSDSELLLDVSLLRDILSVKNISADIRHSINSVEMSRRKFRDIASISGLVFKGYPGKKKKDRHLQSSSQLFFEVFTDHEPDNLLLLQAYEEAMSFQLEEARLRSALERMGRQKIMLMRPLLPTPFAFPIMVDRTREKLSSEKLENRIGKMKLQVYK